MCEEGEKLVDEYDMVFFEISVKENESIDEVFECIVEEIMKRFVLGWGVKEKDKIVKDVVVEIKKKSCFVKNKEKKCC